MVTLQLLFMNTSDGKASLKAEIAGNYNKHTGCD